MKECSGDIYCEECQELVQKIKGGKMTNLKTVKEVAMDKPRNNKLVDTKDEIHKLRKEGEIIYKPISIYYPKPKKQTFNRRVR